MTNGCVHLINKLTTWWHDQKDQDTKSQLNYIYYTRHCLINRSVVKNVTYVGSLHVRMKTSAVAKENISIILLASEKNPHHRSSKNDKVYSSLDKKHGLKVDIMDTSTRIFSLRD